VARVLVSLFAVALIAIAVLVWPRDDVPRSPDAVVVLGGAGAERLELGRALTSQHDAILVLSSSAIVFGKRAGLRCGPVVVCFEPVPETTTGEARAVAALAQQRGWGHVTVATSRFHTTRARVLFRQCMRDDVTVVGATRPAGARTPLRSLAREAGGLVAGLTVSRAC
jgi:uncharacterized SAM-binding protein YcdF (DUF218 family)